MATKKRLFIFLEHWERLITKGSPVSLINFFTATSSNFNQPFLYLYLPILIIMLTHINPKLPMRNKSITRDFYINKLGFEELGKADYEGYLMVKKDHIEIHFFEFADLVPADNYGQVYIRTNHIEEWYDLALLQQLNIPKAGHLHFKPWGQKEFALLDPDSNSLTFGQAMLL